VKRIEEVGWISSPAVCGIKRIVSWTGAGDMVPAESAATDGERVNGMQAVSEEVETLVVVLDETCEERRFSRAALDEGSLTITETDGPLTKNDIELILRMFDTGNPFLRGT
jgi:hypothetical protein